MTVLTALVLMQATSILPSNLQPADIRVSKVDIQKYRTCVLEAVQKMEPSKEGVELIADTAVGSCHDVRDTARQSVIEWMEKDQAGTSPDILVEVAENFMKDVDKNFRSDALAALLVQRASRK